MGLGRGMVEAGVNTEFLPGITPRKMLPNYTQKQSWCLKNSVGSHVLANLKPTSFVLVRG